MLHQYYEHILLLDYPIIRDVQFYTQQQRRLSIPHTSFNKNTGK